MNDGEERGVGADADGQGQGGGHGERFVLAEQPQGQAEIVK